MNHLSYSLASSPSRMMRLISLSISALNGASSLRSMIAYGSADIGSPRICNWVDCLDLARRPYSSTSSIGNASASPRSSLANDSAWSAPSTTLIDSARLLSRSCSSLTMVVPLVTATRLSRKSGQLWILLPFITTMRVAGRYRRPYHFQLR